MMSLYWKQFIFIFVKALSGLRIIHCSEGFLLYILDMQI